MIDLSNSSRGDSQVPQSIRIYNFEHGLCGSLLDERVIFDGHSPPWGLAITNITDENNKEFTPAIKKAHKAHNVKLVAMSNARLIALELLRRRPPPRLILDRPTFAMTKVDVCDFFSLGI